MSEAVVNLTLIELHGLSAVEYVDDDGHHEQSTDDMAFKNGGGGIVKHNAKAPVLEVVTAANVMPGHASGQDSADNDGVGDSSLHYVCVGLDASFTVPYEQSKSMTRSRPLHLPPPQDENNNNVNIRTEALWSAPGQSQSHLSFPLKRKVGQSKPPPGPYRTQSSGSGTPGLDDTDCSSNSDPMLQHSKSSETMDKFSTALPELMDMNVYLVSHHNEHEHPNDKHATVSFNLIGFVTLVVFGEELGIKEHTLVLKKSKDHVFLDPPRTNSNVNTNTRDIIHHKRRRIALKDEIKLRIKTDTVIETVKKFAPPLPSVPGLPPRSPVNTSKVLTPYIQQQIHSPTTVLQPQSVCDSRATKESEGDVGTYGASTYGASTYAHLNVYSDDYFDYYMQESPSTGRKGVVLPPVPTTDGNEPMLHDSIEVDDRGNASAHSPLELETTSPTPVPSQPSPRLDNNNKNHPVCTVFYGMGEVVRYLIRAAGQCDEDLEPGYQRHQGNNNGHHRNINGRFYFDNTDDTVCSTIATEDFSRLSCQETERVQLDFSGIGPSNAVGSSGYFD